jgi:hypothetical protein
MDFIPLQPPRLGLKVYFRTTEGGHPASGVYTVVANDEYIMAGHVVVEAASGHLYGVNAEQLDILEWLPAFHAMQLPPHANGLTFLPSASVLTHHGFIEEPTRWRYRSEVLPTIEFDLLVSRTPAGEVLGEALYGYRTAFSGKPIAMLTVEEQVKFVTVISSLLSTFLPLALRIEIPLHSLGWRGWPEHRPLIGMASDQATLHALA